LIIGDHDPPLALAPLTVLELSPPEMVACAATAGYSHVGLRLLPATGNEPTFGDAVARGAPGTSLKVS